MKLELKSIGYWSVIKIAFVVNLILGAIVGFFVGVFMSFFMALASEMGELGGSPFPFMEDGGAAGGLVMIIMMVFIYGFLMAIFNTILCIIATFIYNIAVKFLGGIEFEFAEIQTPMPPYAYGSYQQPGQPPAQPYYTPPPQRPTPPPPPPPVQPMPPDMKPPEERG